MKAAPLNQAQLADEIIEKLKHTPGALLPILHDLQKNLGFIPDLLIPRIAEALNQTPAEVQGVISFYHEFRTSSPGLHVIQICRAEACQARGSRGLESYAKASLGIGYHAVTADHTFQLEPVYCLGNCACGPSIRIDDELFGAVDSARFDELMEAYRHQVLEIMG